MKVIGLTGGIGTGKSTVSAYLREKGCRIIDADRMAHQMTEKGSPCLAEIEAAFGKEVFSEDGSLERKKLGEAVFADPAKKEKLEQIITQKVIEKTLAEIEQYRDRHEKLVVLDAPLLFECGMQGDTDENWLVVCDKKIRFARIAARDGLGEEEIEKRVRSQMPTEQKEKLADCIIDNSRDLPWLHAQVDAQLAQLKQEGNAHEG